MVTTLNPTAVCLQAIAPNCFEETYFIKNRHLQFAYAEVAC